MGNLSGVRYSDMPPTAHPGAPAIGSAFPRSEEVSTMPFDANPSNSLIALEQAAFWVPTCGDAASSHASALARV